MNQKITNSFYFLFYLIILTAPLVVYGISIGGMSLRFSRLLIILITPIMFLKILMRPSVIFRDNFFVFSVIPYLIYTSISIFWSPNVETGTGVQRLGGLYEIMILYTLFMVADLNAERFLKFIKFYILSAVLPIAVCCWQFANNIFQFSTAEVPFDSFTISEKYELLEGRVFVAGEGFSRISSSFAEPTIFGCFLTSVLLLSLLLHFKNLVLLILLRIFQILIFLFIIFSLSKLALLSLTIGVLIISSRNKKYRTLFLALLILFATVVGIMTYLDLFIVLERLTEETGHYQLLISTLQTIKDKDFIFGEGIGSIPYGSWHRFILSRIYESGILGLIFVVAVSLLPIKIFFLQTSNPVAQRIKGICIGAIVAVIFGLHSYDYFIHLFPWIVIGALMSFYNSTKSQNKRAVSMQLGFAVKLIYPTVE